MRLAFGLLLFSLGVAMSRETSAEQINAVRQRGHRPRRQPVRRGLVRPVGPGAAGQEPLLLAHQHLAWHWP